MLVIDVVDPNVTTVSDTSSLVTSVNTTINATPKTSQPGGSRLVPREIFTLMPILEPQVEPADVLNVPNLSTASSSVHTYLTCIVVAVLFMVQTNVCFFIMFSS